MKTHKTEQVIMLRDMLKSDPDISNHELMDETGLALTTIHKHRRDMGLQRRQPKAPTKVLKPGVEDQIALLLKNSKLQTGEIAERCGVAISTVQRRGRAMGIDMKKTSKDD